ncbi:hypothetical protein KA977_06405 [Candidatus Dependentiae bacterium]|nr:hypothetical protein [Candidatus Dependentiae bacterium]
MKTKINHLNAGLSLIIFAILFNIIIYFTEKNSENKEVPYFNKSDSGSFILNTRPSDPSIEIWSKIFGIELSKPDSGKQSEKISSIEFNNSNYELLGTISGYGTKSSAIILEKSSGQKISKKTGDYIDNMKIIEIKRFEIALEDINKNKFIMRSEIKKKNAANSEAFKRPEYKTGPNQKIEIPQSKGYGSPDNSVKSHTINLTRDEIDTFLYKELEKILTTTNIVPYFVDKKMIGIRFNQIAENSVISRYFGIKINDVITSINGRPVDSVEKGVKLWDNMKNEKYITLDILRDNKHFIFTLNIE